MDVGLRRQCLETCRWRSDLSAAWMTATGRTRAYANVSYPADRCERQVSSKAIGSGGPAVDTHRSRRRFSQRTTGLPWNLIFARAGEEVVDGHSGRSRMPIDYRDNFGAERLHPKVTNWH